MSSQLERTLELAQELIALQTISGSEAPAMECMEEHLIIRGWSTERWPVEGGCFNLYAAVGTPRVLFSTHLDVVPAPLELFTPKVVEGSLFGRGACDAKGIAAVMVEAATELKESGVQDIALLFVVDEERTSLGAKSAAPILRDRGVKYIVNGEPTDCQLVTGHKGAFIAEIRFSGRSCHSGYPELGEDANAKMIRVAAELLEADFGSSPIFGNATINLGVIQGGTALNVVSSHAKITASVRTVTSTADVMERLKRIVGERGEVVMRSGSEPVELNTLPGFERKAVSYATDIPHLLKSSAECLLYGPGSINFAHTDDEHVPLRELEEALDGYKRIYREL